MLELLTYLKYFVLIILLIFFLFIFFVSLYFNIAVLISAIRTKWVPYVNTMHNEIKLLRDKLKLDKWKRLLDLWCWDWKVLRLLVKKYSLKEWIWYDLNHFAIYFGKFLNRFYKANWIKLIYDNFKNANLRKFDYIYVYLMPNTLEEYETWIFENIKAKTIVISNSFQFKIHKPYSTIKDWKWKDRIFFYKKNSIITN